MMHIKILGLVLVGMLMVNQCNAAGLVAGFSLDQWTSAIGSAHGPVVDSSAISGAWGDYLKKMAPGGTVAQLDGVPKQHLIGFVLYLSNKYCPSSTVGCNEWAGRVVFNLVKD